MERTFSIQLGALAPKLTEQFRKQGVRIDAKKLKLWQADQDAIAHLAIRGLIPDSAVHKARQKLCKLIREEA